jgi:hypothetical protein
MNFRYYSHISLTLNNHKFLNNHSKIKIWNVPESLECGEEDLWATDTIINVLNGIIMALDNHIYYKLYECCYVWPVDFRLCLIHTIQTLSVTCETHRAHSPDSEGFFKLKFELLLRNLWPFKVSNKINKRIGNYLINYEFIWSSINILVILIIWSSGGLWEICHCYWLHHVTFMRDFYVIIWTCVSNEWWCSYSPKGTVDLMLQSYVQHRPKALSMF